MGKIAIVLLLLCVGCAAGRYSPQPLVAVDPACGRQCEQIFWTCESGCPKDLGGQIVCDQMDCFPAKRQCLATCPAMRPTVLTQKELERCQRWNNCP